MGDNTHRIPDGHKGMRTPFYGVTDSGVSFEIEAHEVRRKISTLAFANRMMELRIQAAAEARRNGLGIGQARHILTSEVETTTEIVLRVAAPNKIYRIEIEETGKDRYFAKSFYKSGNLRDVVRAVIHDVNARHGLIARPPETPRMAAGGYSM